MARIFERQVLKPSQLYAVAEKRFGDAKAPCDTQDNERANGAMYLCGFVVEILLKARLVRLHSSTAKMRRDVPDAERKISQLIWRSHNLLEMLVELRPLEAAVKKAAERSGQPFDHWLKDICTTWTIHARYSSRSTTIAEARDMLDRVRQLKEILK